MTRHTKPCPHDRPRGAASGRDRAPQQTRRATAPAPHPDRDRDLARPDRRRLVAMVGTGATAEAGAAATVGAAAVAEAVAAATVAAEASVVAEAEIAVI